MGSVAPPPFTTFYNIINGKPRSAKATSYGIDPSTREKLWSVPQATNVDADDAVLAANEAFRSWSQISLAGRREAVQQVQKVYSQHIELLIELLMQETGKPHPTAKAEVHAAVGLFDHHLALDLPVDTWEDEEKIVTTRYVPLGVVVAICPWNFPIILSLGKIIPAILSGCCIILKPSPFTPYTALKIVELIQSVLPAGVVQALAGDDLLGPKLVQHPDVHKISFTGSIATGKRIMTAAAGTLKRVTLELGGNDPSIICPDVDIDKVAPEVVQGCFINSGQVCVATKRVYVHDAVYDRFLTAMVTAARQLRVGAASGESSDLGPIQNAMQYERVKEISQDCTKHGYKFALGPQDIDPNNGYFIQPAIVDDPPEDSRIVQEEPFGPIVPVMRWSVEADVVRRANKSNTGLAACVWSSDMTRAERIAQQLQVGSVFINSWERTTPQAHFCGHKESGLGGEWGKTGILQYCNVKVTHKYK